MLLGSFVAVGIPLTSSLQVGTASEGTQFATRCVPLGGIFSNICFLVRIFLLFAIPKGIFIFRRIVVLATNMWSLLVGRSHLHLSEEGLHYGVRHGELQTEIWAPDHDHDNMHIPDHKERSKSVLAACNVWPTRVNDFVYSGFVHVCHCSLLARVDQGRPPPSACFSFYISHLWASIIGSMVIKHRHIVVVQSMVLQTTFYSINYVRSVDVCHFWL